MNVKIIRGSRSEKYKAEEWQCKGCERVNKPNHYLIFDLTVGRCQCGKMFEGLIYICLADVEVNGHSIIPDVKNQGKTLECVPYAYCHAKEMNDYIESIILGESPSNEKLDPTDLGQMYQKKFPVVPDCFHPGLHKVLYIGLLLREFGCKFINGSERSKISDFFTIPLHNWDMSWQMIADGRAVVVTFMCHSGLIKLKFGEVYDPSSVYHPKRKSKELMAHAVLLIGAISFGPLQLDIFLNSYGEEFCARRNATGEIVIGGIGMVIANRFCNPVVLCRSWEQVVKGRIQGSWTLDMSETDQLLSTQGKRGLEDISCIVGAGPTKAVDCARDETKIFNDGSVLKARADAAFYEEDYARASALYTEAIESGSSELMLYVMRSLCCFHMGDEAKGLHDAYKYNAMKGDCFEHGPALIMMEAYVQSCKLNFGSEGSEPAAQASREMHP